MSIKWCHSTAVNFLLWIAKSTIKSNRGNSYLINIKTITISQLQGHGLRILYKHGNI